jgi:hypothetical protein
MVHELQPIRREMIDVRRVDLLLPVAAEVTDAEIVSEDVNDIGLRRLGRLRRVGAAHQRREQERGEASVHGEDMDSMVS